MRKTCRPIYGSTFLSRLDEIPPPLCRLIARRANGTGKPKMLTIKQIAERAGLTWQKVAGIARQKSFARVTVEDADKFRLGCGITLANEKRHREFIKRKYSNRTAWNSYLNRNSRRMLRRAINRL